MKKAIWAYFAIFTSIGLFINFLPLFLFLFVENMNIPIFTNGLVYALLIFWIISTFLYFFVLGKYYIKKFDNGNLNGYIPLIILELVQTICYLTLFGSQIYFHVYLQVIILISSIVLPFEWLGYTISTKGFKRGLSYVGMIGLPVFKIIVLLSRMA